MGTLNDELQTLKGELQAITAARVTANKRKADAIEVKRANSIIKALPGQLRRAARRGDSSYPVMEVNKGTDVDSYDKLAFGESLIVNGRYGVCLNAIISYLTGEGVNVKFKYTDDDQYVSGYVLLVAYW
jgi:hypothetical protein